MSNIVFKIQRRSSGANGAPSSMVQGALAYNEMDDTLWYGKGTTPVPFLIGGNGGFLNLTTAQTITGGLKTFGSGSSLDASAAGYVKVPTASNATNDVTAASTAFVKNVAQPLNALLTSLSADGTIGFLVQSAAGVASSVSLTGGSGRIAITNGNGVGTPVIDLATVTFTSGSAGTAYPKVTFDSYGRVTAGTALSLADLPAGTAQLATSATFSAGLFNSASITQFSNNTTVATTAWVNALGIGVAPTMTIYSTTPQTLTISLLGGYIGYTGGSAGAFTLPAANTCPVAGAMYVISNLSAQNLTITPGGAGPDSMDEGTSIVMKPGERIALICDGISYWRTAWRTNYANPNFTGNVTINGSLTAGSGNFTVSAAGAISAPSISLTGSQAQNSFLAAPSTGAGAPVFRTIAASDLPLTTTTTAGALIVGTGLNVSAGTVSANVVSVAGLSGTITSAALAGALTLLATLASPTFTGTPSAPTAAYGTNTTQLATTAFVRSVSHDQIAPSQADTSWNNYKITNLADPVNPQDAANKRYVDNNIQGLQTKPTAAVATTGALPSNTYSNGSSGVGATLTATANAILTIDGVTTTLGMVILVKNEGAAANNGLYTVTQVGSVSVPYILTRHVDMQSASEFSGAFIPVASGGTTNGNTLWLCNPSGAVTVGTTSLPFTQLNGATALTPGNGIGISGNTISAVSANTSQITITGSGISIAASYIGQSSITTLGTIGTGVWNGTAISTQYGGLGGNFSAQTGVLIATAGSFATYATIPYGNFALIGGVAANALQSGFGDMAAQASTNVSITGGAISGITLDAGTF